MRTEPRAPSSRKDAAYGILIVVPSPEAVKANVPLAFEEYAAVYADHAGEPPPGCVGMLMLPVRPCPSVP